MLRNSFVLLDGIGRQRESSLWRAGIERWEDFLGESKVKGVSERRKARLDEDLEQAREHLEDGDSPFFASRIASNEQWRCLREFGCSVAYVDIETTGISPRSPITVVGVHDGVRSHTLVRGISLSWSSLKSVLGSASMLVTFNGASFDLPMIESQFPGAVPRVPHVDLRSPLRRLGHTGGLKKIERELDIERDRRVEYMTGEDAVYLWRLWEKHGKKNALDLLIEYNTEDCRNLKALAQYAYAGLKRRTFDAAVRASKIE